MLATVRELWNAPFPTLLGFGLMLSSFPIDVLAVGICVFGFLREDFQYIILAAQTLEVGMLTAGAGGIIFLVESFTADDPLKKR
jgi:hypothetical protein